MFALALSFLIFAASGFSLVATMISSEAEALLGSDIKVFSPSHELLN